MAVALLLLQIKVDRCGEYYDNYDIRLIVTAASCIRKYNVLNLSKVIILDICI